MLWGVNCLTLRKKRRRRRYICILIRDNFRNLHEISNNFTKLPLIFQNYIYLPYCCKSTLLPLYRILNDIFILKISETPRKIKIDLFYLSLSLTLPPFYLTLSSISFFAKFMPPIHLYLIFFLQFKTKFYLSSCTRIYPPPFLFLILLFFSSLFSPLFLQI